MSDAAEGARLTPSTPYIRDLNRQIRKGEIKVPKFQRPFVWDASQALDLLDSVHRNYPVGSLLLWRTPEKLRTERDLGEFKLPEVDDITPTEYVLDGQQRLTVLYSVLGASDHSGGFAAVFDLRADRFFDASKVQQSPFRFPMRWLFETTKLLNFRTKLQELDDSVDLQGRFDRLVEVFTSYQIPVVTLRDLTIEEVSPIFERINSSGTPLSIFDLMVAATWSADFDLNDKVDEISTALGAKHFGDVKGTTVLKALAACEYNSVNRERVLALRSVSKKEEGMTALVDASKKALLRAVDQLITDFKIHSLDFLPYEAHLLILTYVYSKQKSLDAAQVRRLRQWFWRSSFAERYRGAPDTLVTTDLERVYQYIISGDEGKADEFGTVPSAAVLSSSLFRKNNSRSRAFIIALAKAHPLNLTNGAPIDTADALSVYNKKQFHHIFPEAYLRQLDPRLERNYVLNFCMLAASENNLVSDEDPAAYLPSVAAKLGDRAGRVFGSNLLPAPSAYDYEHATLQAFLDARAPVVVEHIKRLCDGDL